jgi:hypothetical protein
VRAGDAADDARDEQHRQRRRQGEAEIREARSHQADEDDGLSPTDPTSVPRSAKMNCISEKLVPSSPIANADAWNDSA